MCNIRRFYLLRELSEADFHKPGIYGSGRVGANAWNVFRRAPSRGSRGRRAAVDFRGVFWMRRVFVFFFFPFFLFELGTHTACCEYRPLCLIYLSTSSEATEASFVAFEAKKPLHTGVRIGCYYFINLYVCSSVCVCMCNIRRFY